MRLPVDRLFAFSQRLAAHRSPDYVIGPTDNPSMRRRHLIRKNRWLNIFLHQFLRSDDSRAPHNHPFPAVSIVLHGGYLDVVRQPGGIDRPVRVRAGAVVFRRASTFHRIELFTPDPGTAAEPHRQAWSLFVTGPKVQDWGFLCERGKIPWRRFTRPGAKGEIGPGCDG